MKFLPVFLKRIFWSLPLLALIGALIFGPAAAAVTLVRFEVATESDQIAIEWETATEIDNSGFFVRRNTIGGTDYSSYDRIEVIDANSGNPFTFIPARGDSLLGAIYSFVDPFNSGEVGTRYYYVLEDVDSSNNSTYHGPLEAVAGQTPTPTSTSAPATATPTASPVPPTNTPTLTATTGPTNTPGPSPTPSPITPTATPSRTNTLAPGQTPLATATPGPGTGTATPEPTETPSATLTFTPTLEDPVGATLTAIVAAVTPLPTSTPIVVAVAPTATRIVLPSPSPSPTPEGGLAGAGSGSLLRVGLTVLAVIVFGGLLTAGIFFYIRRSS